MTQQTCPNCYGQGTQACSGCAGSGKMFWGGHIITCSTCVGSTKERCGICGGSGSIEQVARTIPAPGQNPYLPYGW